MNLTELVESKQEMNVFKALLRVLLDYSDKSHGTSITGILNQFLETGIKALPKEKRALAILRHVLSEKGTSASRMQKLLNTRFSDLPTAIRPCYQEEDEKIVTAFWERDGKIYDKLFSLVNVETGKAGNWCNEAGDSVKLIDLKEKE